LDNKQDDFQLHMFSMSENIAKSYMGLLFWLTLCRLL